MVDLVIFDNRIQSVCFGDETWFSQSPSRAQSGTLSKRPSALETQLHIVLTSLRIVAVFNYSSSKPKKVAT